MVNGRVLEDLLQEPLGPYHDRDILHETACQMKGTTQLILYSFILEHNGRVTGLDESERPLQGQDDCKFRFRGVLKIADPEWLSDFGVKTIETELNLRAKERTLRLGEGARRMPQLTLEELFTSHLTRSRDASQKEGETQLAVLIQGERNMPANFMSSSRVPNGLLWTSKTHNRSYQIATMDEETYTLSENFFWRWRLLALMDKINKHYPWVPPRKRTPGWYVDTYIERFSCRAEDKYRRLISDEADPDVDETGKMQTPRHLLKPHRNEILELFAAQAEWFITNNAVSGKELIDLGSWKKFAEDVRERKRRKEKRAHREAVRRGEPVGQEPESSDQDEEDEDDLNRLVRDNPVIGKSNETVVRKLQLARARLRRERRLSISSGSGSEGDAPGGAEYVSDFSEPSDAEEDDPDHRLAESEAVDRIPWQLQVPPSLPDVDGRWWCPLQECNYQIDLFDLTEEERNSVPREIVAYILQREWRNAAYDKKVLQGFRCMVTNHYMKHFEECGVKVERREGRTRVAFIDGRDRRQGGEKLIRGPMPARGTLGGESRVNPIMHAPAAGFFQ